MTAENRTEDDAEGLRDLETITPPEIYKELQKGVLGQGTALRYTSVAVYKHTTGKVPGNILLIGNSGTGKTTIMNNIQRMYHEVGEYRPFRAMTIINANLLVDAERLEFQPARLLTAVEQRARALVGEKPGAAELKETMERATICIDEIDKMSSIVAGKPNAIGVVLQQGLLTLMEGEVVAHRTHVWEDGVEKEIVLPIDTRHMMFICGGAFEGLYDQVYLRVVRPGSGEKLKSQAIQTADGQVRIETRFELSDFLKPEDLFEYGMVPQFMARFDDVVMLRELDAAVLKEILLKSVDSPYLRSKRYFDVLGIGLELDDVAAAMIAEEAAKNSRTGARALRTVFGRIINRLEFDPWAFEGLEKSGDGGERLLITSDMVRRAVSKNSG
ncbi:MAG: AAA family ATPase [Thermoanaerobaculales bacterium]|jgi:ATP-dependent Clp protease ATP-binding subunit ClpX|nr:AAA family ATPase [Thermoanaerobaculales bacterium]